MEILDLLFGQEDRLLHLSILPAAVLQVLPEMRNSLHYDQRLAWGSYCCFHLEQGTFEQRLRISKESFDKLLGYIRAELLVNKIKTYLHGGTIVPELCLYTAPSGGWREALTLI
jgi:hypothetical protein